MLVNGAYSTFGRPWVLKKIPPFFTYNEQCFKSIPTWITRPSLPIEFWNVKTLSKVVSMVGKAMASDGFTREKNRTAYARVLV